MLRVRLLIFVVNHLLAITMVRGDQALAPMIYQRCLDPANTVIKCFYSLDRGLKVSGVAHHVPVGKVHHNKIIGARRDRFDQSVRHFVRAHCRGEVVSRRVRRGYQCSGLARERFLAPAAEEKGDVRILLGFRQPQLSEVPL